MMVNPISAVRFCANNPTTETTNVLEREGAFAKPKTEIPTEAPKKKSGAGKKILNAAIGIVLTAAALVALHKTNVLKVLDAATLKDANIFNKAGHYLAKAGEFVGKYTYEPIARLFTKQA